VPSAPPASVLLTVVLIVSTHWPVAASRAPVPFCSVTCPLWWFVVVEVIRVRSPSALYSECSTVVVAAPAGTKVSV